MSRNVQCRSIAPSNSECLCRAKIRIEPRSSLLLVILVHQNSNERAYESLVKICENPKSCRHVTTGNLRETTWTRKAALDSAEREPKTKRIQNGPNSRRGNANMCRFNMFNMFNMFTSRVWKINKSISCYVKLDANWPRDAKHNSARMAPC